MTDNSQIIEDLQNPNLELISFIYITPIVGAAVMLILMHPVVDKCFQDMIPIPIQRFIAKILILFGIIYMVNIVLYRNYRYQI